MESFIDFFGATFGIVFGLFFGIGAVTIGYLILLGIAGFICKRLNIGIKKAKEALSNDQR